MTTTVELNHFRERRAQRERHQRLLRNLPLAHRLASTRANLAPGSDPTAWLEQAVVGLVRAADRYETSESTARFGLYATPFIRTALDAERDQPAITAAQAQVADAMASQERVRELAGFLDCPVEALVGGLLEAAPEVAEIRADRLRGAA